MAADRQSESAIAPHQLVSANESFDSQLHSINNQANAVGNEDEQALEPASTTNVDESRLTTASTTPMVASSTNSVNEAAPKLLLPAAVDAEESSVSALVCVLQSLCGGSIYGYNTAIISGLNTPLIKDLFFANSTTSNQATMTGVLTSSILIGAFISTMLSLPFTNRFGRKISFLVCGAICILACLALGIAEGFVAVAFVRGVLGLSVGMTATVCPLYSAECAPASKKGVVGAVFQLSVVTSVLVAEIVNYVFNPSNTTAVPGWAWRTQLMLGAIPGVGLLLIGLLVPESPVWIEQRRVLHEREQTTLQHKAAGTVDPAIAAEAAAAASVRSGWAGLFHISNIRWLALSLLLAAANQLTGINAIIYYAPQIFTDAGYESLSLVLTIIVVGVWDLVSVLISLPLIKRFPARSMMIAGQSIMLVGLILITVVFSFFSEQRAIPAIISILIFLFGYGIGPGPLFFALAADAFPKEILHAGLSLANQSAWGFNILVTFVFPLLNVAVGGGATFGVFLLISILVLFGDLTLLPRGHGHQEPAAATEDSPLATIDEDEDEMVTIPTVAMVA